MTNRKSLSPLLGLLALAMSDPGYKARLPLRGDRECDCEGCKAKRKFLDDPRFKDLLKLKEKCYVTAYVDPAEGVIIKDVPKEDVPIILDTAKKVLDELAALDPRALIQALSHLGNAVNDYAEHLHGDEWLITHQLSKL